VICKRTAIAVAAIAGIALVSFWAFPPSGGGAPAAPVGPTLPQNTWVERLPVDGRLVTCVYYSAYGISCDWAGARPLDAGSTIPAVVSTPPS
jgi:hypothetical protein